MRIRTGLQPGFWKGGYNNDVVYFITHCKKRGVSEHPRGAIFYFCHGNPYCYHGNSKILLPWGVPIHHVFYSELLFIVLCVCVCGGGGGGGGGIN